MLCCQMGNQLTFYSYEMVSEIFSLWIKINVSHVQIGTMKIYLDGNLLKIIESKELSSALLTTYFGQDSKTPQFKKVLANFSFDRIHIMQEVGIQIAKLLKQP